MSTLIVFVVALIIICKWGIIKDAWNGKLPPPISSNKKPWRYAGYNVFRPETDKGVGAFQWPLFRTPPKFRPLLPDFDCKRCHCGCWRHNLAAFYATASQSLYAVITVFSHQFKQFLPLPVRAH